MKWHGECCGDECLELGQAVCSEWLRRNDPPPAPHHVDCPYACCNKE